MLSPLKTALTRVYSTIPPQILKAAFEDEASYDVSMDELIKQKVIVPRVLEDVSQRAGKIKNIVLQLAWARYAAPPTNTTLAVSGAFSVFVVPPEEREYSDMLCVLDMRLPYSLATAGQASLLSDCSLMGNTVGGLACAALQSATKANMIPLPTCRVGPGNCLIIQPEVLNYVPWIVRVRLRYDDEFATMDIQSIDSFNQLVEWAVKAYIYNNLIFNIETNPVYRGVELGIIREIVQTYSDANDKYSEYLLALQGSDVLSPTRLRSILSKMVPSG